MRNPFNPLPIAVLCAMHISWPTSVCRAELRLEIHPQTLSTWLTNLGSSPLSVDAYSIESISGRIVVDQWTSIASLINRDPEYVSDVLGAGALDFEEYDRSADIIGELNIWGFGIWQPGIMWSIGFPFGRQVSWELNELLADLIYEYHVGFSTDVEVGTVSLLTCGDFDRDQDVDTADLTVLLANWTGSLDVGEGARTFSQGDCDLDGDVDMIDLTGTLSNWTGTRGDLGGQAAEMIPEPAAGILLAMGVLLIQRLARRRGLCAGRAAAQPDQRYPQDHSRYRQPRHHEHDSQQRSFSNLPQQRH